MGWFLRAFFRGLWLSFIGYGIKTIFDITDLTKVVHNHHPGPCRFVKGVEYGAEDLAVLPNGMAILSTGLKEHESDETRQFESALMSFDFSSPDPVAQPLEIIGFKDDLNPHGVSLHSEHGQVYVYVVNHPPYKIHPPPDTVVKFRWEIEKRQLIFVKSFGDPEFHSLNDLVVVDKDTFYASNMWIFHNPLMREVENLLLFWLPLQNVVYFDGINATVVLPMMYGPNGINVSPDKKFLYVSEVHAKRVSAYEINSPVDLRRVDSIALGSIADNIDVHPRTGDLWLGCHPLGYKIYLSPFYKFQLPSQVLRVSVKDGKFVKTREVFVDDGANLAASTIAAHYNGLVLIGSLNHKALVCRCLAC